MSKIVMLTVAAAYVNGVMRHPHEGPRHLEDGEADRLINGKEADDVTSDFTAEQRKAMPVERSDADPVPAAALLAADATDHQANIPATEPAAAGEAPKSKKETSK
ncbi:hypothetical protein HNP52_000341 [Sphingomonas kyeonggiensis]|uniref:Uncharacterized protein n=1 Tax=Sphingomonas kyeonggiensis TaxID=1268553 RepID=A0A7W7NPN3_9SPHN|nr:hypothetical protein [Sphingomonas kyeonggiensis]MBB4837290.1 hypothetical protein [Sphingomonas kyeonggiensis]